MFKCFKDQSPEDLTLNNASVTEATQIHTTAIFEFLKKGNL